jgi:hypothetical protein
MSGAVDLLHLRPVRVLVALIVTMPIAAIGGLAEMGVVLHQGNNSEGGKELWIAALVVVALSAGAVALGRLPRSPWAVATATFAGSMVAAILCAPATLLALGLPPRSFDPGHVATLLLTVTFLGMLFSVPAGLVLSSIYAVLTGTLAWSERSPARTTRSIAGMVIGVVWTFVGYASSGILGRHTELLDASYCADALTLVGLALTIAGGLYLAGHIVWLRWIRRGKSSTYRIVRSEIDDLVPIFPWGNTKGVLMRIERTGKGPFRQGETLRPIARVSL